MEAAWLAVVVTIPLFFNLSSSRMFESDKVYVLKFLVVISGAAWLIKRISARFAADDQTGSSEQQASFFKLPLAIPVLVLAGIYTLSSVFSISPAESWWGSYNRSQGTIVIYCYTILFLIVLSQLRTSAQMKRLKYAFILTSIPVSAYSILQSWGSDFIPWTDFFRHRSSGSIGNPIFLGAYLIMVIPLTIGRFVDAIRMLRGDGDRRPGFILLGCCSAALIMHFLALLYTQSRGPVLGLVVSGYICFFIFLVLRRTPASRSFICPAIAVALGCMVPVLIVAVLYLVSGFSVFAAIMWLFGAIALIGVSYLLLWRISWGRQWLWLTWFIQTVVLLLIVTIGAAQIISQDIDIPSIGRLTNLSGNSIDARYYLWQAGCDAMRSDSSATLPDDSHDSFSSLRQAIGYGPECIWIPVNLHASPKLFNIHSGASDRMHNEMFDNLISMGFIGAAIYLFLFSAAMFYSIQYLDLMRGARQKILFAVLLVLGCGAGILLPWYTGFPQMTGIGVQAGLLSGLFAYVAWIGFQSKGAISTMNSGQIFAFCILGSILAHFAEISVGIAITPTRTYFFLFLAALSVLVSQQLKQGTFSKKRSSKPLPWRRTLLPGFLTIASFIVLAEAWCFIVNTTAERSAAKLFIENWFVLSEQQSGFLLPGNLMLLFLTIGGGIALAYAEKSNLHLSKRDIKKIPRTFLASMIIVWLVMGFLAAVFWAAKDPSISTPVEVSIQSEARITLFLLGLLVLLTATVSALAAADTRKYGAPSLIRNLSFWLGLLLFVGAFVIVFNLTVRPAWADVACHIARVYERAGNFQAAIRIYERAVQLAPRSAHYLIALGSAQRYSSLPDSSQLQESAKTLQRAVELNPLDPSIHRGLGIIYTQIGERASNPTARNAQMRKAIASFQQVIRLAPNSKGALNDLGRGYFLSGDYAKARQLYERSLQIYPKDKQTYMYLGEMQYALSDLEGALQSFTEAARLEKDGLDARKNIGSILVLLGRKEEAIREDLVTLEMAPQDLTLLRRLSSLYFSTRDYSSGLAYARRAYDATPEADKQNFDAFLEKLQNQIK